MSPGGKTPILPYAVTLLFTGLATFTLLHHEMWRDELQAWLIARDSSSLGTFFHVMRYEGTPPLWHMLLLAPARWGASPLSMQLLHLLLGTFWVFLLCRYSPFNPLIKVLLSFSYYVFYQYTIISRNYVLGLLLLTLACVFFKERENRPDRLGIALALAALTSAPAWIVASGLACASRNRRVMGLFLVGALCAVFLMLPPDDALFPSSPGWIKHFHAARVAETLQVIVKTYFPTPQPTLHFWENPWLAHLPLFSLWSPLLAVGLVIAAGALCMRTPEARITYLTGTLGLIAFFYFKYLGYSRHHGFLFFNFIFALWLAWDAGIPRRGIQILTVLLAFQMVGTATAVYYDTRQPFSCGKAVAQYLVSSRLENKLIAAGPDYIGVPVAGYLRAPFYAAQGDRQQTFTLWDRRRIEMLDDREFVRRAHAEAAKTGKDILMLINYPLNPNIETETRATFLRSFTGSILGDEDYYLYLL